MEIEQFIHNIYPISEKSLSMLAGIVTLVEYPKGHLLIESGKIERNSYFIKQGLVRAYKYYEGNEVTFWFGKEGAPVLAMMSYVENKPAYENIELLENSILYKLNNADLNRLYSENVEIANWGRKLAEKELIMTEERFISRQFKTASERYNELITQQPDLLQRVQLGYIASYLGITQVTLSRIRAERTTPNP